MTKKLRDELCDFVFIFRISFFLRNLEVRISFLSK